MTAKEKALDLVSKFNCEWMDPTDLVVIPDHEKDIECAKIAVDEILELNIAWINKEIQEDYPTRFDLEQTREFWQEVKQELEKM